MARKTAREKTTLTVDRAKLDRVRKLTGAASASAAVDEALELVLRHAQLRRDVEAYTAAPPSDEEIAIAAPATVWADLADDTDWEALYATEADTAATTPPGTTRRTPANSRS